MPIEELDAGNRIDVTDMKEDPMDFALWKAAKEGELMVVDVVSENAEHRVSHIQKYCDFQVIVPTDCKLDADEVARRYFDSFNDAGRIFKVSSVERIMSGNIMTKSATLPAIAEYPFIGTTTQM